MVKGYHKPVDISLHIFHTVYLGIDTSWQIIGINDSLNFRTVWKKFPLIFGHKKKKIIFFRPNT